MSEFSLTVIGCGSALPMHGRHPSAQVVQYENSFFLIDCGEGTQERLKSAGIKIFKIGTILISHLHGDHVFGLPGLLSTYSHLNRKEKLSVYGPVGLKGLLDDIIRYCELRISFPLKIIEKEPKKLNRLFTEGNLEVSTFPLYHRIPCNGYLLKELLPKHKLSKDRIHEFQLTIEQIQSLKRGEDIEYQGKKIEHQTFILGKEHPVSYAYCSDTRYDPRIIPWLKDVSVLYHETTYMNNLESMAHQTGHSTSSEAGRIATAAKVSCLITGHYSSRYKEIEPLLEEACKHFEHSLASEEGKKYDLRKLALNVIPTDKL